jgi:hypothetical protein
MWLPAAHQDGGLVGALRHQSMAILRQAAVHLVSSLSPWLVPVVFLGGSGSALAQAAMIRAIDSTE